MSNVFIGKLKSGITEKIKHILKDIDNQIIILDFSNEYEDITKETFLLDDINLFESQLNYTEMKAINAGYLGDNAHCFYQQSEDLIFETDEYKRLKEKYNGDRDNDGFKEEFAQIRTSNLIDDTLTRMLVGHNKVRTAYAKELNEIIPKKRSKNHISLETAIAEKIINKRIIRLQYKTIQSEHQRAVAYCLLTRLSHMTNKKIHVVADEIPRFFNDGNTKLFLSALNLNNIEFIYAFNKPSIVPKAIIPTLDVVRFYKLDVKFEINKMKEIFSFEEGDDIADSVKKLKKGQCRTYVRNHSNALAFVKTENEKKEKGEEYANQY